MVFAIPYEGDFTLIGTTDVEHDGAAGRGRLHAGGAGLPARGGVGSTFARRSAAGDIVWSYSGVRPLYDDGASSATAATRDYVIDAARGRRARRRSTSSAARSPPTGGCRRRCWRSSRRTSPGMGGPWTARAPLPGGDFPRGRRRRRWRASSRRRFPFLDAAWAARLVRGYGTEAAAMLAGARTAADLGERFGWDLTEREVRWLMEREWARDGRGRALAAHASSGCGSTPARRRGWRSGWRPRCAKGRTGARRGDRGAALRSGAADSVAVTGTNKTFVTSV